ncbi:MAG: signal peptidase I [Nanoarchaeota archaeon]
MNKENLKKFWNKFWFIVWKDDSLKGWIISIIFIFIIIKFIFFPLLSLATGTALPLAIVESCSMYHQGNLLSNFNEWWQSHEDNYNKLSIGETDFEDFIFKKGFNKGDILFIAGTKPENVKIGDVIIFNAGSKNPIIHRVVKIKESENGLTFSTMGDNVGQIQFFEQEIKENQLVGKAVFKLAPYLGWVKLVFYEPSRSSSEKGFCSGN